MPTASAILPRDTSAPPRLPTGGSCEECGASVRGAGLRPAVLLPEKRHAGRRPAPQSGVDSRAFHGQILFDQGPARLLAILSLFALLLLLPSCREKPDINKVGGTAFTVEIQKPAGADGNPARITNEDRAEIISLLEHRFAKARIGGVSFKTLANGKISIELPGIVGEQAENARGLVETGGKLELKKVNLDGFKPGADGRTFAERVLAGDEIVPGFKAYIHEYEDDDGKMQQREVLLLARKAAVDGRDVQLAGLNASDDTKVDITLTSDGEDKMIALTKDMTPVRDRIAIVLDGKIMSAPVVISTPLGRQFVIEGMKDAAESRQLAAALLNPMKYPLKVVEERTVSPELARKTHGGDKPAAPAPAEGAPEDPTNK